MPGQGSLEDGAGAMNRYRPHAGARRSIGVDGASVDRAAYQAARGLTMRWIAALRIATVPLGLFMTGEDTS
jgi:hypothetical protein